MQYYTTRLIIRFIEIQTHYPTERYFFEFKVRSIRRCCCGHITDVKIDEALYDIGIFWMYQWPLAPWPIKPSLYTQQTWPGAWRGGTAHTNKQTTQWKQPNVHRSRQAEGHTRVVEDAGTPAALLLLLFGPSHHPWVHVWRPYPAGRSARDGSCFALSSTLRATTSFLAASTLKPALTCSPALLFPPRLVRVRQLVSLILPFTPSSQWLAENINCDAGDCLPPSRFAWWIFIVGVWK